MDIQIGSNAIYTASMQVFNYRVDVGGVTIYRGRAIASPSGRVTVNVSNIVEDYLNSEEFPKRNAEPVLYGEDGGYVKARLYRINADETTTLVGEYGFLRSYDEDWSAGIYDSREEVWTGQSITMSNPINGRLDPRMQQLYTVYRRTSGETINWGIVPKIRVIPDRIIADPDGGSYDIIIESNVPFTATTDSGWISISGSGGTYVVTVTPNPGDDRNGGIVISYLDENDNPASTVVPVIQEALNVRIIPESISFGPDGGESRFTVISNVDVTPTSSADWLTFVPVRTGDGFVTYKLVVDPNRDGYEDRTATINARGAVLNINQEAFKITVNIDTAEYSWAEGEGELIVTANGNYEITTDVEWLRVVPASGQSGTTRFTVIVDENDTIYEREGHIIIGGTVITITQARQSYIAITPMTWTAAATGGSMNFQISDRFEHSWEIRSSGLFNVSQTAGTGNATVTISIGAATSTSSYAAAPKLVDMTTGEEIQFVLKRKAPVITVTPSTIAAAASGGTYAFTVFSEIDYTLNDDSDWITLSATGGTAGTTEFTATVNLNATMSEKTGHIKVFNANKITVTQEASQIAVSPTHIDAAALGSAYTITVTSNTLYDITVDADWLTVPSSGGTGVTEILVTVDDNLVPSGRTATIMIGFIPVTVTQEALVITLSSETGNAYPDAPSRTVLSVTSNGKYPVYTEYQWIAVDTQSGTSGTTIITITNTEASTNEGVYLRNGTVHIGYQTFTLCQQNGEDFLKYLTFTVTSGGTVTWSAYGDYGYQEIYYSKNGGNWTSLFNGYGTQTINVVKNDVLRFKAFYDGSTHKSQYGYSKFGGTAKVDISGNILSMAYMDAFPGARRVPVQNYWIGLFTDLNIGSTYGFVLPSNVPASEQDAYKYLRSTSVINAYNNHIRYTPTVQDADDYLKFEILTSGTLGNRTVSAGEVVTVIGSSKWPGSLSGNTATFNLSGNVASIITSTGFANDHKTAHGTFENMFAHSNVVDASRLKVPLIFTHQGYLRNMFADCTMLTAMPDLTICGYIPEPSNICEVPYGVYEGMFSGCTALTAADKLPILTDPSNVGDRALKNMFNGCTSLSRIKDVSNVTTESIYGNWAYGVASAGTFEKRISVSSWSSGTSGIPYNWTAVDIRMPATLEYNVMSFHYTGGTDTLHIIDTDEAGWNITGVDEWVTLSTLSGTGSTNVSVTVASAVTDNERYNDIKLHSGGKTWNIHIYENGIVVATVEPTLLTFSASQQTKQLTVRDYGSLGWTISGMPEWLTVSTSAGTGNATVSVTASGNTSEDYRIATLTFTSIAVSTEIGIKQYGTGPLSIDVVSGGSITVSGTSPYYVMKNDGEWSGVTGITSFNVSEGDVLKYKGAGGIHFTGSTASYNVRGNAMSLLYGDDYESQTAVTASAFYGLFENEPVIEADGLSLPATKLASYCYYAMFKDCTLLTSAPMLPATSFFLGGGISAAYCYAQMFSGCSSLTEAPALPSTTLSNGCYSSMFNDCVSLTTAPALPAEYMYANCYQQMFRNCTSLTTAPELSVRELADYCYSSMFRDCISLTSAPTLSVKTLAVNCYEYMFAGCTSLETAPDLPATGLTSYCYQYMFSGCTSLSYIKCLATSKDAARCTYRWVADVASSGTFVYKSGVSWKLNTSGAPVGWTYIGE